MTIKDLDVARTVLRTEADGLCILADQLDDTFVAALDLIFKTKGRLIVSGVGKSGHVGRKMAATFASTGQPAFFVHAAEAGHGDLGMIANDDTLLLISYSGKARELQPMIDYAHRFSIPIIAITGNQDSPLAQHATKTLLLPSVGEACPMGLAPTTSTTLTIAIGDALAVSLLSRRGFTKQDFNVFHPGGNLGFQLKSIQDFMHTADDVPFVQCTTGFDICLDKMSQKRLGCVGVLDHAHKLCGIITDGDIRRFIQRHMNQNALKQTNVIIAQDIMTKDPVCLHESALLGDALSLFELKKITNVFVINDDRDVVGLLHIHDCLRGKAI